MGDVRKLKDLIKKYFITGLFLIIPVWATYYVLTALLSVIDGMLGDLPQQFTGLKKFPGMGIITLILFILLVGMFSANFLGKRIVAYGERLLQNIPVVRGLYVTFKQIMGTFSMDQNFHGVAVVEYPRKGCWSVGFMTGEVNGEKVGASGRYVTVFVPTTPNPTAGFLLILPENEVIKLDMSVDQGMKFIVSLGLVPMSDLEAKKLVVEKQGAAS